MLDQVPRHPSRRNDWRSLAENSHTGIVGYMAWSQIKDSLHGGTSNTTIFMPCNKDSNLCWTAFLLLAVLKGRLFFLIRYSACAFMGKMLLFLCCLFVHLFPYLRANGPASPCTRTLEGTFTPYMLGFEIGVWSLSCFQIQLR